MTFLRTYSRCTMFDCSDTVFRRRNVTRRRISNTVLQPRYWGSEADSPEVCRLGVIEQPNTSWSSARASHNKSGIFIPCIEFALKKYWSLMKVRNQPTLRRMKIYYYWTNIRKWNYFNTSYAYQIPYYSRGIEEAKRTHPRFADWV
jgi:hypothetical protein